LLPRIPSFHFSDNIYDFFIFIIFNLEHKWTRLMLCPSRNGCVALFRQPITPTAHYSDNPNRPSKVIWKVFLYLYFCHVWKDLKGGVETVLEIIFLTGYRHFHLEKRKVKQVLYMKMLRKRCLRTVIFVLESPWKVLDFAQQKIFN
jgi:hypothetical protein